VGGDAHHGRGGDPDTIDRAADGACGAPPWQVFHLAFVVSIVALGTGCPGVNVIKLFSSALTWQT
jgi:hypothetical protein